MAKQTIYCLGWHLDKQENETDKSGFSSQSFNSSFEDATAETGRGGDGDCFSISCRSVNCEDEDACRLVEVGDGWRCRKLSRSSFRGKTAPKPGGQEATPRVAAPLPKFIQQSTREDAATSRTIYYVVWRLRKDDDEKVMSSSSSSSFFDVVTSATAMGAASGGRR